MTASKGRYGPLKFSELPIGRIDYKVVHTSYTVKIGNYELLKSNPSSAYSLQGGYAYMI
ncbi:hypothetical protein CTE07_20230 [Chitinophaga terrae (ex Kim and Jung 2007)]|nr:hypothetical protein CTE07_20230 [Chitinophaga terrae (ex Kim and Jung 2007)]